MKIIYSSIGTESKMNPSTTWTSASSEKRFGIRTLEIVFFIIALLSSVALFAQGNYSSLAITEQNADMSSLVAMNVRFSEGASKVSWKIKDASEPCTYVIQRSADRTDFMPIAKIIGLANEGTTEYFYTDTKPLSGPSYYRIVKVNKTGSYNYSAVYSVNEQTIETAGSTPTERSSAPDESVSPSRIITATVPNFR